MTPKQHFKSLIRIAKKSEYGGVWYSSSGPISISKEGQVARFGVLLKEDKLAMKIKQRKEGEI